MWVSSIRNKFRRKPFGFSLIEILLMQTVVTRGDSLFYFLSRDAHRLFRKKTPLPVTETAVV